MAASKASDGGSAAASPPKKAMSEAQQKRMAKLNAWRAKQRAKELEKATKGLSASGALAEGRAEAPAADQGPGADLDAYVSAVAAEAGVDVDGQRGVMSTTARRVTLADILRTQGGDDNDGGRDGGDDNDGGSDGGGSGGDGSGGVGGDGGGGARAAAEAAAADEADVDAGSFASALLQQLAAQDEAEKEAVARQQAELEELKRQRREAAAGRQPGEAEPAADPADPAAGAGAAAAGASGADKLASTGVMFAEEDRETGLFDGEEWVRPEGHQTALEALQDRMKRRQIPAVDHDAIEYPKFRKKFFTEAADVAAMSEDAVAAVRARLQIGVRGRHVERPIEHWHQAGIGGALLKVLEDGGYERPFAIQRQALPVIMAGADVIGVAKTGSGKTLAFLIPLLRHVLDQPTVEAAASADGPVGLVIAPARELAKQIYAEARKFCRPLGMRAVAVYGGGSIADQIAEVKRGASIIVATPGRLIDLLALNGGRVLRLFRTTMLVLDEADRMFDMGFEPQIARIVSCIRPQRQTVMFSATFPQSIQTLARHVLRYRPVEITVGSRSAAPDTVEQFVEVRGAKSKFRRLLQLLGTWYDRGAILVFVDTQEACDDLFIKLMRSHYRSVTLHGGKNQEDRDSTLREFKRWNRRAAGDGGDGDREEEDDDDEDMDGEDEEADLAEERPRIMVATSVAGRGLDVKGLRLVVNYDCPNHLEDYVHRVGRTGRAGKHGTAFTFITPDEGQFAPDIERALLSAKQDVPAPLKELADSHREAVKAGTAKKRKSGYSTKGFTFDGSQLSEEALQKELQRLQYEHGMGELTEEELAKQEAELREKLKEVQEKQQHKQAAAGAQRPAKPAKPVDPATLALLRAKAHAAARAAASGAGSSEAATAARLALEAAEATLPSEAGSAAAGQDTAAAQRTAAAAVAKLQQALGASGASGGSGGVTHTAELEINAYPQQARMRVTSRESIASLQQLTGCGFVMKGVYVPPGRRPPAGERPLTMTVEGRSPRDVQAALRELRRQLDEQTSTVNSDRAAEGFSKWSLTS